MSHGDSVRTAPDGFRVTAVTDDTPVAAFEDSSRGLAGVQFHPEVLHTEHGQTVLEHFLHDIAGIPPTWTSTSVIDEQVALIRAQVGDKLVTSGLGGVYPADLPVATITDVRRDPSQPLVQVRAAPVASLDRDREVMIVWYRAAPASPAPTPEPSRQTAKGKSP